MSHVPICARTRTFYCSCGEKVYSDQQRTMHAKRHQRASDDHRFIAASHWLAKFGRLAALALFFAFATGCAGQANMHARRLTASAAVMSLAMDWCQTSSAAREDWSNGRREGGMPTKHIIGTTPSQSEVGMYFAVGTVAIIGVAQLVPERFRPWFYGAVTVVEAKVISGNLATASGDCL